MQKTCSPFRYFETNLHPLNCKQGDDSRLSSLAFFVCDRETVQIPQCHTVDPIIDALADFRRHPVQTSHRNTGTTTSPCHNAICTYLCCICCISIWTAAKLVASIRSLAHTTCRTPVRDELAELRYRLILRKVGPQGRLKFVLLACEVKEFTAVSLHPWILPCIPYWLQSGKQ